MVRSPYLTYFNLQASRSLPLLYVSAELRPMNDRSQEPLGPVDQDARAASSAPTATAMSPVDGRDQKRSDIPHHACPQLPIAFTPSHSLRRGPLSREGENACAMQSPTSVRVPLRPELLPECATLPTYQTLVRRGVTESIAPAFHLLPIPRASWTRSHQAGQFHQNDQLPRFSGSRRIPHDFRELQLTFTRTSDSREALRGGRSRITRGEVRRRSVI